MSTQPDRSSTAPEAHWYSNAPAAAEPAFEQMLSETQAVERALARLGRGAPAAEVRRLLGQHGLDVPESVIEDVRAQLPPEHHGA
jgi:hypothetical protein